MGHLPGTVLPNCTWIIFGAAGDLTKRKLMPSLYNLLIDGQLPDNFALVGVSRRTFDFAAEIRQTLQDYSRQPIQEEQWQWLTQRLYTVVGDLEDTSTYQDLKNCLDKVDVRHATGANHIFYLAIPADYFGKVVKQLGEHQLNHQDQGFTRIVIEKPFGHDLASAQLLQKQCLEFFTEEQIYRIDHYLGKEAIQSILPLRVGNPILEAVWNRQFIKQITITAAESIGIEGRGNFYEKTGHFRDMVQGHLLQVLSLTAMDIPQKLTPEHIRLAKTQVLNALQPIGKENLAEIFIRGQYVASGECIGYRQEPDVAANSMTETFVALTTHINTPRWQGVPFILRTGKRLPQRLGQIEVEFKVFDSSITIPGGKDLEQNKFNLRWQPSPGLTLTINGKSPGSELNFAPMPLTYAWPSASALPDAYERLLLDCWRGDQTLFVHGEEVLSAWRYCDPILQQGQQVPLMFYPAGTQPYTVV